MDTTHPDPARLAAARDALAAATAAASASAPSLSPTTSENEVASPRGNRRSVRSASESAGTSAHSRGSSTLGGADDPEGLGRARQVALRQLAMGPRTRKQLTDKMLAKECAPDVIERVLDRMSDVGLVDDQAYAHMLVRTKREGSGMAVRGLRHELRKKGVPEHMAEAAVEGVQPEQEREQAEALVASRLPRLYGLERDVQIRRLGGFLARKGYPSGLSFAVIKDALDRAPEHQRD